MKTPLNSLRVSSTKLAVRNRRNTALVKYRIKKIVDFLAKKNK